MFHLARTDSTRTSPTPATPPSWPSAVRPDGGLPRAGTKSAEYLEAAALLANVGLFISHAGHHKHSYYVIRNSEQLTGFTDHEIELIAQVARYHRKSAPKARGHAEFAALGPTDQRAVRLLAGLLRIAIGLDRGHACVVRQVRCDYDHESNVLSVEALVDDPVAAQLEQYTADARKDLAEEALGLTIRVDLAT